LIGLSLVLLVIGLLMLVSSRDLIRLLISLEFMFSAIFLSVLYTLNASGYEVLVTMIFTSCCELMVLVGVVVFFSRKFKTTSLEVKESD